MIASLIFDSLRGGYLILSYELYRTRCVPTWAGILTMLGSIIFGVGLSGVI